MDTIDHVYSIYIKASPDRVWRAITDGDETVRYYYGTRVTSDWTVGRPLRYDLRRRDASRPTGGPRDRAAATPVVMSFHPRWARGDRGRRSGPHDLAGRADRGRRLEADRHERAQTGSKSAEAFAGGIVFIVSGLKTFLETGQPLAGRLSACHLC